MRDSITTAYFVNTKTGMIIFGGLREGGNVYQDETGNDISEPFKFVGTLLDALLVSNNILSQRIN